MVSYNKKEMIPGQRKLILQPLRQNLITECGKCAVMKNRKSIFELERRINLRDAYKSVIDDLRETIVNPHAYCGETLFQLLDKSIKTWPYRNASNSIDMYARYHGFSLYGSKDEDMMYSFELIANLLCWVMKNESESSSRRAVLGVKYGTVTECQRCYENIKYLVE